MAGATRQALLTHHACRGRVAPLFEEEPRTSTSCFSSSSPPWSPSGSMPERKPWKRGVVANVMNEVRGQRLDVAKWLRTVSNGRDSQPPSSRQRRLPGGAGALGRSQDARLIVLDLMVRSEHSPAANSRDPSKPTWGSWNSDRSSERTSAPSRSVPSLRTSVGDQGRLYRTALNDRGLKPGSRAIAPTNRHL